MNLYEIKENYLDFLNKVEEGEIDSEFIKDTLEAITDEFEVKADNLACYIKNLSVEAQAISDEAKRLSERAKTKQNKADKLKEYLQEMMLQSGIKKVETTRNAITMKLSPLSVNIADGFIPWALIHKPELVRYKAPEPDKNAIKELIKLGEDIGYCTLEQSEKINIK